MAAFYCICVISNRFSVYKWTGEYDLKKPRMDTNVFENGEKRFVFKQKRITVDGA